MKRFLLSLLLIIPIRALAHAPESVGGGFITGFSHPIIGFDHLVAMIAVGLWGAFLGDRAFWMLPIVFPSIMAVGAAVGIMGFELPLVELMIALSGVVLGALIALRFKASLAIAMVLVGIFALFHGYAHGTEMPGQISAFAYGAGFVIGTGLLHLAGMSIGFATRLPRGELIVRGCGGVISVIGLTYLVG
ncbi:MAG: HupE/UreJ family protein [Pseudomonadota bacterium]|nr:HupE/UreJ family protein [Pseudomonadota bacterium]